MQSAQSKNLRQNRSSDRVEALNLFVTWIKRISNNDVVLVAPAQKHLILESLCFDTASTAVGRFLKGVNMSKTRAPPSGANPSNLVDKRVDTEDDVLHVQVCRP